MLALALPLVFALAGVFAVAVIGTGLHRAAPAIAGLRRDLARASVPGTMRFRVVETVVRVDDGKVVSLPVRQRPVPQSGWRAAA
ncbi:MAG: hypothetical protein JSR96_06155 [Proteobacteria bacterium]|nr:hypothetical protein [Pseudomonadota bacterium]